jgi:hypothetical protein
MKLFLAQKICSYKRFWIAGVPNSGLSPKSFIVARFAGHLGVFFILPLLFPSLSLLSCCVPNFYREFFGESPVPNSLDFILQLW